MTLFTFEKDEGKKILSIKPANPDHILSAAETAALNDAAANSIQIYLGASHFPVTGLSVTYDMVSATATVKGLALDPATHRKIVECCGSIYGVQHVDDHMGVATAGEISRFDSVNAGNAANESGEDVDGGISDSRRAAVNEVGSSGLVRSLP